MLPHEWICDGTMDLQSNCDSQIYRPIRHNCWPEIGYQLMTHKERYKLQDLHGIYWLLDI